MQGTRQRILDYLSQRGTASSRQLAQAFSMTPANLRRHLSILQSRGLVTQAEHRPIEGRGRPQRVYALTASALPNGLQQLSAALLDQSAGRAQDAHMKQLAHNLLGDQPAPSGQITQRLVAAVQRLVPLGYRPRWEARPNRPEVVFGHCPYAAIIAEHPELCRMDAHMLHQLLGTEVEQLTKLQAGPQGTLQCIFAFRKS